MAQGLDTILEAADLLHDRRDVQFVLAGDGTDLARLKEAVQTRGLNNVIFLGRLPAEEMPRIYALADALLIHLRDDPLFRITIPHKVFTYMASGKPVLAAVAGDAASVIESEEAGLTCAPGDAVALASTARELLALPEAKRCQLGENGRRAACKHYARAPLVAQIDHLLEDVLAAPRPMARWQEESSSIRSTAT